MAVQKGDKWYGVLKLKCPRCHEGDLFKNKGFIVFSKILDMPEKCPKCKQDFILEPGFYSAALWISYPMVLLLIIPTIFLGLTQDGTFLIRWLPIILIIALIFQIPIMRISRAILIQMTISYDDSWQEDESL